MEEEAAVAVEGGEAADDGVGWEVGVFGEE